MAYKTARVRPQGLSKEPIFSGTPDYWSDVSDIVMRETLPARLPLDAPLQFANGLSEDQSPYYMVPVYVDPNTATTAQWYLYCLNKDGTFFLRSAFNGVVQGSGGLVYPAITFPNECTGDAINGFPVICRDRFNPFYYDPLGAPPDTKALPNLPTGVQGFGFMRRFRDFLIGGALTTPAVGTGQRPDDIAWSNRAVAGNIPDTWIPSATNEAGDLRLQGTGPCRDGAVLGDGFVVYKDQTAHLIREVGLANGVLGARQISSSIGVNGRNCIQSIDNQHYMVTQNDIVRWDGNRGESLLTPWLRKWFFEEELILERRDEIYTWYDERHGEFGVAYPASPLLTFPSSALIYNGSAWSVRSMVDTTTEGANGGLDGYACAAVCNSLPSSLTSTFAGKGNVVYFSAPSTAASNNGIIGGLGTSDIDSTTVMLGTIDQIELEPGQVSLVTRVRPQGRNLVTMSIIVGSSDLREGPYTTSLPVNWTPADAQNGVTFAVDGRFHNITVLIGAGDAGDVRLAGFDIDFEPGSRF